MGAGHAHALYVHEHSPVHRLPPQVKLVAVVAFVAAVAVTPREAIWAFALHGAVLTAVIGVARLPLRFVLSRMIAVLPFILFAFLIPFVASGEQVSVLGVEVSREGLWGMWNIIAKALLGITASIILAGTTEIPDLLRGMERLRLPRAFTAIASFMIRYLELIAGELRRMRTAMAARGYEPRWLWQARPLAASAGTLFIRSYERGERVHAAMLARGFSGHMPDLDPRASTAAEWARALLPALAAAVVAALALVLA